VAGLTKMFGRFPLWFWLVIVFGIVLRIASISWNDRLIGDVNLFALTAKEYSESGKLYYPMKYDFSRLTKWGELKTPQSQHPPLWSFLGGVLGQSFGIKNSYGILQLLSLCSQFLLMIAVYKVCLHFGRNCVIFVVSAIALSPMMIDFAGNGSQYTMGAAFMLMACLVLLGSASLFRFFLAGILCGLAYCTHGAFVLNILAVLVVAIIWGENFQEKVLFSIFCILGFLLALSPMFIFRIEHFGSIFHNLNSIYLGGVLGKLNLTDSKDGIFWMLDDEWVFSDVLKYAQNCLKVWSKFLVSLLWEWGPTAALLGIFCFFTKPPRKLILVSLFFATLIIPILLWPGFKTRFLLPLLPIFFLFSYLGFKEVKSRFPKFLKIGQICRWGVPFWFAISWICSIAITGSPSRYYTFDLKHKKDYQEMLGLTRQMHAIEKATLIGSAKSLDGGVEGVYYHDFPYVHARGFDWNKIERLRTDYNAQYFWTDEIMLPQYEENLKNMELLLHSGKFRLYRFAESNG
jgi:hypothetical protein